MLLSLRVFKSLITSSIGAILVELLGVEVREFRRVTVFGGAQARSEHRPVKYGNLRYYIFRCQGIR
jgi:hypothetical protein